MSASLMLRKNGISLGATLFFAILSALLHSFVSIGPLFEVHESLSGISGYLSYGVYGLEMVLPCFLLAEMFRLSEDEHGNLFRLVRRKPKHDAAVSLIKSAVYSFFFSVIFHIVFLMVARVPLSGPIISFLGISVLLRGFYFFILSLAVQLIRSFGCPFSIAVCICFILAVADYVVAVSTDLRVNLLFLQVFGCCSAVPNLAIVLIWATLFSVMVCFSKVCWQEYYI